MHGLFGEGSTVVGRFAYVASLEGVINKYDLRSRQYALPKVDTLRLPEPVWGLTSDEETLYLTYGLDRLLHLDPKTFERVKEVPITMMGHPLYSVNELDYYNGHVYGNVFGQPCIVRIDPDSGVVDGVINLQPLQTEVQQQFPAAFRGMWADNAVLNGVAFEGDHMLVTGKMWPKIYELSYEGQVELRE